MSSLRARRSEQPDLRTSAAAARMQLICLIDFANVAEPSRATQRPLYRGSSLSPPVVGAIWSLANGEGHSRWQTFSTCGDGARVANKLNWGRAGSLLSSAKARARSMNEAINQTKRAAKQTQHNTTQHTRHNDNESADLTSWRAANRPLDLTLRKESNRSESELNLDWADRAKLKEKRKRSA